MDSPGPLWYFSCMYTKPTIPVFTLFGETDQFPDVIHCESIAARAPIHDWRIEAHRHAHMAQLFAMRSGQLQAVVDGQALTMEDMSFLFIPAHFVHEFTFKPGTKGTVISLPNSVINAIGPVSEDLQSHLTAPVHGQLDEDLNRALLDLESAIGSTGPFRDQRAVGLAHSVLAQVAEVALLSRPVKPSDTDARLRRLDALLSEKMEEGWTASDYAAALSLTTGHLSRLCREATGAGATAYIDNTTMVEACRLLAFTQLNVSEVGYRLGYADPSYFSKRFRKLRGLTPSEYRATFTS